MRERVLMGYVYSASYFDPIRATFQRTNQAVLARSFQINMFCVRLIMTSQSDHGIIPNSHDLSPK